MFFSSLSKACFSAVYPKTAAQLETVDSEDDVPLLPHAQHKVRKGCAVCAVWWLTECAQGKNGSGRQLNFEASDDDFATQSP